jgi:hypothetical protein
VLPGESTFKSEEIPCRLETDVGKIISCPVELGGAEPDRVVSGNANPWCIRLGPVCCDSSWPGS